MRARAERPRPSLQLLGAPHVTRQAAEIVRKHETALTRPRSGMRAVSPLLDLPASPPPVVCAALSLGASSGTENEPSLQRAPRLNRTPHTTKRAEADDKAASAQAKPGVKPLSGTRATAASQCKKRRAPASARLPTSACSRLQAGSRGKGVPVVARAAATSVKRRARAVPSAPPFPTDSPALPRHSASSQADAPETPDQLGEQGVQQVPSRGSSASTLAMPRELLCGSCSNACESDDTTCALRAAAAQEACGRAPIVVHTIRDDRDSVNPRYSWHLSVYEAGQEAQLLAIDEWGGSVIADLASRCAWPDEEQGAVDCVSDRAALEAELARWLAQRLVAFTTEERANLARAAATLGAASGRRVWLRRAVRGARSDFRLLRWADAPIAASVPWRERLLAGALLSRDARPPASFFADDPRPLEVIFECC